MIKLRSDCLCFLTRDGSRVPCSAIKVARSLLNDGVSENDLEKAIDTVLAYFRREQRDAVTVREFSAALRETFIQMGYIVDEVETDYTIEDAVRALQLFADYNPANN